MAQLSSSVEDGCLGSPRKPCNNDKGKFLNEFEYLFRDDYCSTLALACSIELWRRAWHET
jgi:hypothetical protein